MKEETETKAILAFDALSGSVPGEDDAPALPHVQAPDVGDDGAVGE